VETSTSRLRLAPDDHSDTKRPDGTPRQRQKAPLADQTAVLVFAGPGRGARRHHTVATNEGASCMAKRTRTPGLTDKWTRHSAEKITPASSDRAPVPTTPAAA
jgi:hypothetical protein